MQNQLNEQELFNWLVLTINIGGTVHPKDSVRCAMEQFKDIKRMSNKIKQNNRSNESEGDLVNDSGS